MNNKKYQHIILILLSFALVSCAAGPSRTSNPVPVAAGFIYKGSYINVRVPNSDGWHLVESSPAGMQFARSGAEHGESFAAQVLIFPLENTKDSNEFLSLIKSGIKNDTDSERFEIIKSNFKNIDDRNYPCVRVNYATEDKQAQTSPTRTEVLLLEAESLYCRHPVRQDTGFSIIYSHRGKVAYSNIKTEAQDFINGVQVPGQ